MLDVLLDALIDTAKLLPFLFVVYFLIEFLEYKKVLEFEHSTLLKGKASPVFGALCGSVPQCGFSVVSAELYSKQKISVAALIAVFIATSDEAFPIMISNYKSIPALLFLMLTKIIIAIITGYAAMFIFKKIFKDDKTAVSRVNIDEGAQTSKKEKNIKSSLQVADEKTDEQADEHTKTHLHACCHHDIEDQQHFNWKHPIIHSLKIALYIFIANILIGGIIALIGEDNISNFLSTSSAFQPIFALIVGIIPNCASSVLLTELYCQGIISFGSIVTGLCMNAGIGMLVLFRENKNIKQNLFIVLMLIISSLVFGYALHFIPMDFLRI